MHDHVLIMSCSKLTTWVPNIEGEKVYRQLLPGRYYTSSRRFSQPGLRLSPSGATFHLYSAVFYSQKVINTYILNALSTATETRGVGSCSRGEAFAQASPEQNVIGKVVLVMKPCGFILFRFFSPSIYLSLASINVTPTTHHEGKERMHSKEK